MIYLKIKEYMDARGISRYSVSEKSGIRYPIVDRYYKNQVARYDTDILDRICHVLDCTPSDLIGYKKQNSPARKSRAGFFFQRSSPVFTLFSKRHIDIFFFL